MNAEEKQINESIQLAKELLSLSADARQALNASQATWIASALFDLGYRKFEIVEGDV